MGIFKKSTSMTETERELYDARINKLTVERDQYRRTCRGTDPPDQSQCKGDL